MTRRRTRAHASSSSRGRTRVTTTQHTDDDDDDDDDARTTHAPVARSADAPAWRTPRRRHSSIVVDGMGWDNNMGWDGIWDGIWDGMGWIACVRRMSDHPDDVGCPNLCGRRETRDARRETRNSGRARRLSSSRIVVVDARDDARDDEDEDEDEDEDDRVIAFGGVDLKSRRAVRASSSEIGLVIDW